MKVLAIETSTPASSVALAEDRSIVASAGKVDRKGHSAFLVSALDFCFDQADWKPQDLSAVVVDVGPGLYTGIRVGLATAQGLAAALGVPLLPGNALDSLALRATTGRRHIYAIVDVRRGEWAVASYRPVPGGVVKDGRGQLVTANTLRGMLESDPEDVLLVGDWESLPGSTLTGLHRMKTGRPRYPVADALIESVAARLHSEDYPHPDEIRPLYMREPDVQIGWEQLRSEGPWEELA